jgi:hypothetical protein
VHSVRPEALQVAHKGIGDGEGGLDLEKRRPGDDLDGQRQEDPREQDNAQREKRAWSKRRGSTARAAKRLSVKGEAFQEEIVKSGILDRKSEMSEYWL